MINKIIKFIKTNVFLYITIKLIDISSILFLTSGMMYWLIDNFVNNAGKSITVLVHVIYFSMILLEILIVITVIILLYELFTKIKKRYTPPV